MNIDLFITPHGEAGLLSDRPFTPNVIGAIYDAQTQEITLELGGDGGTLHMNIPMEDRHRDKLLFTQRIYIGTLQQRSLADAIEVPLLYLNDPYGSHFGQAGELISPRRTILAFEQFMRRCIFAQGLHRENLGDETGARSILRGLDPRAFTLTPALLRQRQMAAAPATAARQAPQMPGMGSRSSDRIAQAASDRPDAAERSGDGSGSGKTQR